MFRRYTLFTGVPAEVSNNGPSSSKFVNAVVTVTAKEDIAITL